jgi:hypothetical protein
LRLALPAYDFFARAIRQMTEDFIDGLRQLRDQTRLFHFQRKKRSVSLVSACDPANGSGIEKMTTTPGPARFMTESSS